MFKFIRKKDKKAQCGGFYRCIRLLFTHIFDKQTTHISQAQETRRCGTHHVFCPFNHFKDLMSDRSATTLHHTADGQIQRLDNCFKVFSKRKDSDGVAAAETKSRIDRLGRYIEVQFYGTIWHCIQKQWRNADIIFAGSKFYAAQWYREGRGNIENLFFSYIYIHLFFYFQVCNRNSLPEKIILSFSRQLLLLLREHSSTEHRLRAVCQSAAVWNWTHPEILAAAQYTNIALRNRNLAFFSGMKRHKIKTHHTASKVNLTDTICKNLFSPFFIFDFSAFYWKILTKIIQNYTTTVDNITLLLLFCKKKFNFFWYFLKTPARVESRSC